MDDKTLAVVVKVVEPMLEYQRGCPYDDRATEQAARWKMYGSFNALTDEEVDLFRFAQEQRGVAAFMPREFSDQQSLTKPGGVLAMLVYVRSIFFPGGGNAGDAPPPSRLRKGHITRPDAEAALSIPKTTFQGWLDAQRLKSVCELAGVRIYKRKDIEVLNEQTVNRRSRRRSRA